MTPVDVNEDNESIVWQKLDGEESDKPFRFKSNIGDQVRISKARRTFETYQLCSFVCWSSIWQHSFISRYRVIVR
jgi:hypothetical protein